MITLWNILLNLVEVLYHYKENENKIESHIIIDQFLNSWHTVTSSDIMKKNKRWWGTWSVNWNWKMISQSLTVFHTFCGWIVYIFYQDNMHDMQTEEFL